MRTVKQLRSRKARAAPGSNRDRILDAALALFNARGVRDVTTNHIAGHLGISPGNLYYHFANKEEIVRALLPRIEAAVRGAIALPEHDEVTAERLGAYYLAGLDNLSAYPFFFADLNYLVARDPELGEHALALHDWLLAAFRRLFRLLQRDGHMDRALGGDELAAIAVNAYLVWFSWLGYVQMVSPDAPLDRAIGARGALQSFLVLAPHLEAGFRARARTVLERGAGVARAPRRRGA